MNILVSFFWGALGMVIAIPMQICLTVAVRTLFFGSKKDELVPVRVPSLAVGFTVIMTELIINSAITWLSLAWVGKKLTLPHAQAILVGAGITSLYVVMIGGLFSCAGFGNSWTIEAARAKAQTLLEIAPGSVRWSRKTGPEGSLSINPKTNPKHVQKKPTQVYTRI
jgi:hypothetical protein